MRPARWATTLIGLVVAVGVACAAPAEPPDVSNGVPVVDRTGRIVGTADASEMARVGREGGSVEVTRDGKVVGRFGPDGFVPAMPPPDS